ncbi:hypothetical protein [Natronoglycomyces albus]|uniref:Uncharacterized protein n=1 Tax=Natronoglycomyces albus TaxID=2811108 RepID=A0A895XU84_9ACTN|nr:hypothetical protein [Natronoglycomyces albus]QSB06086.1 hypothetical protein JQS30_03975 [Natronoglycomyces albus]
MSFWEIIGIACGLICCLAVLGLLFAGWLMLARQRFVLKRQKATLSNWASKRGMRYLGRDDSRLRIVDMTGHESPTMLASSIAPPEKNVGLMCHVDERMRTEHVITGRMDNFDLVVFQRHFPGSLDSLLYPEAAQLPEKASRQELRHSYVAIRLPSEVPLTVISYAVPDIMREQFVKVLLTTGEEDFDAKFTVMSESLQLATAIMDPQVRRALREASIPLGTRIVFANGWCFIPEAGLLRPGRIEKHLAVLQKFIPRIPAQVWEPRNT